MRRNRLSFIVSFMPPLCMAFMLGFELLVSRGVPGRMEYVVASAEILPFLLPLLMIVFLRRVLGGESEAPIGGFTRHAVPFVLLISLTAAVLSFLLNAGLSLLLGDAPQAGLRYAEGLDGWGTAVVLVVLLPAIFEELFFRGGVLPAFQGHGTLTALLVSSLSFACVHGNIHNFAGPLAAGLIYGYLSYALGSIWPAVFAHGVNNALNMLISHMTRAYSTLGIWPYFLLGLVFCLGLLLYLSMGSLKKLLDRGKLKRLRPGGAGGLVSGLLFSPGLWLLALMYFIRVAYL